MKIELTKCAMRDLDLIEHAQSKIYKRILLKIQTLTIEPRSGKALVGSFKGKYSLRVGDYRIIYEIISKTIFIITINHRREVYKK